MHLFISLILWFLCFISSLVRLIADYSMQEHSVISSNTNLALYGQGLLKLTGDGDCIKSQRLLLSQFYNITVRVYFFSIVRTRFLLCCRQLFHFKISGEFPINLVKLMTSLIEYRDMLICTMSLMARLVYSLWLSLAIDLNTENYIPSSLDLISHLTIYNYSFSFFLNCSTFDLLMSEYYVKVGLNGGGALASPKSPFIEYIISGALLTHLSI